MTLPNGTEPLVLADGTKIDPASGVPVPVVDFVEVPTLTELQERVTNTRRRLSDLPVPPRQLNTISVILFYKTLGVTDEDIAGATGLTLEQVGSVAMSDVYAELKAEFVDSLIRNDLDNVRNLFVLNSKAAAAKSIGLINSSSEEIALRAAKDVLDRAGHRPADVVEHRHLVEGGLIIEHVDKKKPTPEIDIIPDEVM